MFTHPRVVQGSAYTRNNSNSNSNNASIYGNPQGNFGLPSMIPGQLHSFPSAATPSIQPAASVSLIQQNSFFRNATLATPQTQTQQSAAAAGQDNANPPAVSPPPSQPLANGIVRIPSQVQIVCQYPLARSSSQGNMAGGFSSLARIPSQGNNVMQQLPSMLRTSSQADVQGFSSLARIPSQSSVQGSFTSMARIQSQGSIQTLPSIQQLPSQGSIHAFPSMARLSSQSTITMPNQTAPVPSSLPATMANAAAAAAETATLQRQPSQFKNLVQARQGDMRHMIQLTTLGPNQMGGNNYSVSHKANTDFSFYRNLIASDSEECSKDGRTADADVSDSSETTPLTPKPTQESCENILESSLLTLDAVHADKPSPHAVVVIPPSPRNRHALGYGVMSTPATMPTMPTIPAVEMMHTPNNYHPHMMHHANPAVVAVTNPTYRLNGFFAPVPAVTAIPTNNTATILSVTTPPPPPLQPQQQISLPSVLPMRRLSGSGGASFCSKAPNSVDAALAHKNDSTSYLAERPALRSDAPPDRSLPQAPLTNNNNNTNTNNNNRASSSGNTGHIPATMHNFTIPKTPAGEGEPHKVINGVSETAASVEKAVATPRPMSNESGVGSTAAASTTLQESESGKSKSLKRAKRNHTSGEKASWSNRKKESPVREPSEQDIRKQKMSAEEHQKQQQQKLAQEQAREQERLREKMLLEKQVEELRQREKLLLEQQQQQLQREQELREQAMKLQQELTKQTVIQSSAGKVHGPGGARNENANTIPKAESLGSFYDERNTAKTSSNETSLSSVLQRDDSSFTRKDSGGAAEVDNSHTLESRQATRRQTYPVTRTMPKKVMRQGMIPDWVKKRHETPQH